MNLFNDSDSVFFIESASDIWMLHPHETLTLSVHSHLGISYQEKSRYDKKVKKIRNTFKGWLQSHPYEAINEIHIMTNAKYDLSTMACETITLKDGISEFHADNAIIFYHCAELTYENATLPCKEQFIANKETVLCEFMKKHKKLQKKELCFRFFNFPPIMKHLVVFVSGWLIATLFFNEYIKQQKIIGSLLYLFIVFLLITGYSLMRYRHFYKEMINNEFEQTVREALKFRSKNSS